MAGKKAKGGKRAAARKRTAVRASKTARKSAAGKPPRTPVKKVARKAAKKAAKKAAGVVKKVARTAKKAAARVVRPAKSRKRPAAKKPARTKDGRPPNWPALSPYMTVRDAAASVAFYEAAFGFKVEGELMRDDSGQIMHAGMRLGDACIMFAPQGMDPQMRAPVEVGGGFGLSLYVYVADVDALAARALRAGADLQQAPADQFWGDRIAIFVDPDGYHWTFATHVGEFDASKAPH